MGTFTGDIAEICLNRRIFKRIGPGNTLFQLGINCMSLLANGDLLIGAGDGTVAKLQISHQQMKLKRQEKI